MTSRVLVIGAGPAGLAAAVRLLEKGGDRVRVRIVHQGHHLGGKAASYRDPQGHLVEHGWHMVVGFYERMRRLMRTAGVDDSEVLTSMDYQSTVYEPATGHAHAVSRVKGSPLKKPPLPMRDALNFARFLEYCGRLAQSGEDLTRYDDICFRTFAVQHGLYPHAVRYAVFRVFQEFYFNLPESISAYHSLQTWKLTKTKKDNELSVCRGGYSEEIWEPIGAHVRRLGGTIEPYTMATDFVYDGRTITGVRVARPDGEGHHNGLGSWPAYRGIPVNEDTRAIDEDFDYVISTIPVAVLQKMNTDDERMWSSPYFSRLKNLRSGATVSMTVVTRQPVFPGWRGPVFGLRAPLGIVTDMKPYWKECKDDDRIGAALVFVGQENGFEDWTDEQIVEFTLDQVAALDGVTDPRTAGILRTEIHRNRSDFERLFLCEPGVQQFRPGNLTPFHNLFVAGDWVKNEVDVVCMEGAITSGENAADEVLSRLGDA